MGFFIALVLSVSSVLAEDVGCLHCVAQLQAFVPKEAIRLLAQTSVPNEKKAVSKTNLPPATNILLTVSFVLSFFYRADAEHPCLYALSYVKVLHHSQLV